MAVSENSKALPVARRLLLGGGAALTCARPAPACPLPAIWNPDAALISAAAEVRRTIAEENALPNLIDYEFDSPEVLACEAEVLAISDRRRAAIKTAAGIRSITAEGLRAKADIAQMHFPYAFESRVDKDHETIKLVASLVEDILRGVA